MVCKENFIMVELYGYPQKSPPPRPESGMLHLGQIHPKICIQGNGA